MHPWPHAFCPIRNVTQLAQLMHIGQDERDTTWYPRSWRSSAPRFGGFISVGRDFGFYPNSAHGGPRRCPSLAAREASASR